MSPLGKMIGWLETLLNIFFRKDLLFIQMMVATLLADGVQLKQNVHFQFWCALSKRSKANEWRIDPPFLFCTSQKKRGDVATLLSSSVELFWCVF